MTKRIKLNIEEAAGVDRLCWPVTQGVPFADKELKLGTVVRVVDSQDNPLPTQSRCLATWDKDQKYVRWLLVDFQVDVKAEQRQMFFLEYGDGVINKEHPSAIEFKQMENVLRINTGALRLDLRNTPVHITKREKRDPFVACSVVCEDGWREMFLPEPGPFVYMTDQHNNVYDSCSAGPRPVVTVEESGPIRTSIRINGYHCTKIGHRFCPYILRIHLFAGKSDMRIYHTFIFDQEPHDIELKSIGLNFPLDLGMDIKAAVGGDKKAHGTKDQAEMDFLQENDRSYQVSSDGRKCGSGTNTRGWASLKGTEGSAVAVIRNCWQEFPKGFVLSKSGIDVKIWPDSYPETLKFITPFEEQAINFGHNTRLVTGGTRDEEAVKKILEENPTAPLNLKSLKVTTNEDLLWVEKIVEKYAPERTVSYNDTGTSDGAGAAKTTEIYFRLSADEIGNESAEQLARAVQEPLIAPADPAYACRTKAFGYFYHAGDEQFKEIDRGLDELFKSVISEPVRICRLYGMMRYGNMVCSHAPGPAVAYLYYKDSEPEKALRYVGPYNNEANDQIMGVWGNFLRTGKREHYFTAQNYSRTIADVATCHAHPTQPEAVGLMHYHNAHVWSGCYSPSHTLLAGILTDYYLSGNMRLLEVARETADWAVRNQEPCGIIPCRLGRLHREFTGPLWSVLEVYRATWEEQYGELASRSLNWFLRALPKPGSYYVSVYTRGERGDEAVVEPESGCTGQARDMYHLFESALRLFNSKTLREHIIAEANNYVWDELTDNYLTAEAAKKHLTPRSLLWPVDNNFYWTQWTVIPSYNTALVCLAYKLTGNMIYAAYAKDQLEGTFKRQAERCRHFADWRFTWLLYGSYIPRLMGVVAEAMEKDPEGLKRTGKDWKEKRAGNNMTVYEGRGVDLKKDEMDCNGNIISRTPVDLPREKTPRSYEPETKLGKLSTEDHEK